ncbi:MAG: toll/interleukin-1 receptor domain-containing protein [Tateyamaria sp.]
MRSSENLKKLVAVATMISLILTGFGLVAIEGKTLDFILTDLGWRPEIVVALFGLSASIFASVICSKIIRRSHLRRRARRVFIIYPHESKQEARDMAELLQKNDVEPWLDINEISAGEVWRDAIAQALDESAMAVVLLTEHSGSSEFVKSEIKAAVHNLEARDKKTSPVIPVLYEGGEVPSSLRHIHYVDMSEPDAEAFLVKSIFRAMERVVEEKLAIQI